MCQTVSHVAGFTVYLFLIVFNPLNFRGEETPRSAEADVLGAPAAPLHFRTRYVPAELHEHQ